MFGFEVAPTDISILEASTGLRYNAKDRYYYKNQQDRYAGGSPRPTSPARMHSRPAFKLQWLVYNQDYIVNEIAAIHLLARRAERRSPSGRTPLLYQIRTKADLGLYAQDKWTIRRLTLNYGLRFEYFNGYVPATSLPAGRFVGARDFPGGPRPAGMDRSESASWRVVRPVRQRPDGAQGVDRPVCRQDGARRSACWATRSRRRSTA